MAINTEGPGLGSPYQLTACPWCGSAIEGGKHLDAKPYPHGSARTLTYCGDKFGQCLFSRRQAPDEGLPVVVVDEEIYRRLPTLLIATVDKFAQMPWKGEVQMLFGQVNGVCERHGFKSPEIEDSTFHPRSKAGLPAAKLLDHSPLRPPDLVIQDELHLISGPLGTLVGLYETAIDKLCTWEVDGKPVRPKVIASTATIKNADVQVRSLFLQNRERLPAARPRRAGQLLLRATGADRRRLWSTLHRGLLAGPSPEGGTHSGHVSMLCSARPSTRSTARRSIRG